MSDARRPARTGRLLGGGIVASLVLMAVGVVLAFRGYHAQAGPEGVVRSYFAALVRGDAPAALAYGPVPAGPHTLLTSTVLARQQHTAPLRHFSVTGEQRSGSNSQVQVRYQLDFPGSTQTVTSTVPTHRRNDIWRLTSVAVPTRLHTAAAADRIVGLGPDPGRATSLVFPGAIPASFDTPLLALDPATAHIEFGAAATTDIEVVPSAQGRTQARAAVRAALTACLDATVGTDQSICPQPSERYVPGSLRGTLTASTAPLDVSVAADSIGVLQISGTVNVDGTWRRLTFANQPVAGSGEVQVPVFARCYAVAPLHIVWADA